MRHAILALALILALLLSGCSDRTIAMSLPPDLRPLRGSLHEKAVSIQQDAAAIVKDIKIAPHLKAGQIEARAENVARTAEFIKTIDVQEIELQQVQVDALVKECRTLSASLEREKQSATKRVRQAEAWIWLSLRVVGGLAIAAGLLVFVYPGLPKMGIAVGAAGAVGLIASLVIPAVAALVDTAVLIAKIALWSLVAFIFAAAMYFLAPYVRGFVQVVRGVELSKVKLDESQIGAIFKAPTAIMRLMQTPKTAKLVDAAQSQTTAQERAP